MTYYDALALIAWILGFIEAFAMKRVLWATKEHNKMLSAMHRFLAHGIVLHGFTVEDTDKYVGCLPNINEMLGGFWIWDAESFIKDAKLWHEIKHHKKPICTSDLRAAFQAKLNTPTEPK